MEGFAALLLPTWIALSVVTLGLAGRSLRGAR